MENKNLDKNTAPAISSDLPTQGSGSILASERKRQQREVLDIARDLNLTENQIKAIEKDQTEGLPEATYVRGYIRSYAKLLGLNPEEVLENYLNPNWKKATNFDDLPQRIQGMSMRAAKKKRRWGRLLLLLLILAAGYAWYAGYFSSKEATVNSSSTNQPQLVESDSNDKGFLETEAEGSPITEADSALTTEAEGTETVDESSEETQAEETGAEGSEQTEEVVETKEESATEIGAANKTTAEPASSGAAAENRNQLTMTFEQTSWVDVRDNDNNRLAFQSYTKGETLKLSHDGPMHVFLGNSDGVNVEFNGKPFDFESFREGVFAKFSLGAKN